MSLTIKLAELVAETLISERTLFGQYYSLVEFVYLKLRIGIIFKMRNTYKSLAILTTLATFIDQISFLHL
jgi:hypothetical protein